MLMHQRTAEDSKGGWTNNSRALKNQGRLKWIQKSNLLQVKALHFLKENKKNCSLPQ